MKVIIFCVLPALFQCFPETDPSIISDVLYKGEVDFSINFLRHIASGKQPTENVFFSPFSIYNALLLCYFISAGDTELLMKKAMFIPDSEDQDTIGNAYKVYKDSNIIPSRSYELLSANSLFVPQYFKIERSIELLLKDEIIHANFSSFETIDLINSWVASHTKNEITELIKSGDIDENTILILVNGAYFKGQWKNKFSIKETRKKTFTLSNSEKVPVTMMSQMGHFQYTYSDELQAEVLEIPYLGNDMSMYVLLPFENVTKVLSLFSIEAAESIFKNSHWSTELTVFFPKFEIEEELQLRENLQDIGFDNLFSTSANLSKLTGYHIGGLTSGIHKAKVRVDEKGTTAAAASMMLGRRSAFPLEFNCNRPFIYLIYHKSYKAIIFTGIFNRPPA